MRTQESPDFADSPTKPDLRLADPDNKNLFEKLSQKGRSIASSILGRANDPLKKYDLLAGALIGSDDHRINIEEKKSVKLEEEIFELNEQIKTEQKIAVLLQNQIDSLKTKKIPTGGLESELKKGEQGIKNLIQERDKKQTECEARTNKMSELANSKTDTADMIIERYRKAIKELEIEQDALLAQKENFEIQIEEMKADHAARTQELDECAMLKAKVKAEMLVNGISQYEIETNSRIQSLAKLIADGNQQMRADMADLTVTKEEIVAKIIKIDKQIAEYRDIVADYSRNKEIKPISISLPERTRQENPAIENQIEIHRD